MKSTLDVATDIWGLLNKPPLTSAITGKIWKFARPADSDKIDVVIGLLGLNNDATQVATVNVAIHLPNRKEVIDGKEDNTMPDINPLTDLVTIVTSLLDCQWKETFDTEVIDSFLRQDTDGHWFARLVVRYQAYNREYKNI